MEAPDVGRRATAPRPLRRVGWRLSISFMPEHIESPQQPAPTGESTPAPGQKSKKRPPNVVPFHEQAGRVPPQAMDVEQSVIGAMLIEREAIPRAIEILPADAFTRKYQLIASKPIIKDMLN